MDPWKTLGVARGASEAEVRAAFRHWVWETHPDRGGDASRFRPVVEAYRWLVDLDRGGPEEFDEDAWPLALTAPQPPPLTWWQRRGAPVANGLAAAAGVVLALGVLYVVAMVLLMGVLGVIAVALEAILGTLTPG